MTGAFPRPQGGGGTASAVRRFRPRAKPRVKGQVRAEINVTPLVDVVLVLLIIFIVLVPSMLKELTANIPRKDETNTPPDPSASPVVVEYTAKGELSLNQEPVAPEALGEKVAEKIKYKSQKVVFFKIEDDALAIVWPHRNDPRLSRDLRDRFAHLLVARVIVVLRPGVESPVDEADRALLIDHARRAGIA